MQQAKRRSNLERAETTRQALLGAARGLFIAKGYAETSTPEIVAAAGITRGALYHHFEDKKALFRALLEAEARAIADEIEAAAPDELAPIEALEAGGQAYLRAMAVPGRTRLLLIEGPAVLGLKEMAALDAANGARTLREGLEAALPGAGLPIAEFAQLLSAAFDRAALATETGEDAAAYGRAVTALMARLVGAGRR